MRSVPDLILRPPGLVGEIAKWIDDCAVHQAPLLSVASALSIVSTLCGRRYALPSGLRSCTYIVGIAQSGVGKEAGRQCAVGLLDRCGLRRRVGTGSIASGAGLVSRLVGCPTQLFLLDEFGRLVEGFASRNAGNHEREIMTVLMELWSAAPGVFLGKAYAEKDSPVVEQPHTVVYATTTPESFYAALKGRDVVDGVLSRMLLMEVDHGQLAARVPTASSASPPAELIARCKRIAAGPAGGNLADFDVAAIAAQPLVLPISDDAARGVTAIGGNLTKQLGVAAQRDLWVRAKEQALRIALAIAVGQGHTEIEAEDLEWAWSLVRWCTHAAEQRITSTVADTEEGACALAMVSAIAAVGSITRAELERHRSLGSYPRRVRREALAHLLDKEAVAEQSQETGGRPTKCYVLTPHTLAHA